MARDKRSGGRPDGEPPVGAGKPAGSAGSAGNGGKNTPAGKQSGKSSGKPSKNAPAPPPDIRVQLPYFAARIAVFVLALVLLLVFTNLLLIPVVLFALLVAGVSTYPLARMQKKAAARAAKPSEPGA